MRSPDNSATAGDTGFEFRVLGPLEVLLDGEPVPLGSPLMRALLACLVLEPNQVVSVDRLVDNMWDREPPATARTIIQGYISRLRRFFGERGPVIATRSPGYALQVDTDRVDAHRARALINNAHLLPADERSRTLSEALELWRGPVLADLEGSGLHQVVSPNLDELRLLAVEERVAADLELGRHHRLVLELPALVDANPLRERLTGQLMLAGYRAGHRAQAQARYHALRERLSDELGIDPGPQLRELYERLLRDDERLMNPEPGRPAPAVEHPVPAELPPAPSGFVGRSRELSALDRMLAERASGEAALTVLTGTAGVGKSALGLTWSHRVLSEFPDGQLYASLRGFDPERAPLVPGEALTKLLKTLGVAGDAIPVEVDDRAALYRSLLAERRMLVLLDDARDSDQVRPLLPGSSASWVLVTSRRRLDGLVVGSGARVLPLETLPTETSIELLDRAGVPGKPAAEPAAAAELADLCGGLPLALRIAAARMAANPVRRVADLVGELTEESNRLQGLDIDDANTSVRRAFDISYRSLHPLCADMFRLLGLVPGHTFTVHAVAALCGTDVSSARRRLRALGLAHLVSEPEPGRYGMHDLLRVYARNLLADATEQEREERGAALRRLLNYYSVAADHARRFLRPARDDLDYSADAAVTRPEVHDRDDALEWFDAEWPNLVAAVRAAKAEGLHELCWPLVRLQFNYLMVRCPWEDWVRIYSDGADSAGECDDPSGQLLMAAGLGVAHARSGNPEEALAHYEESHRIAAWQDDPSALAMTRVNMGSVLYRLERYGEAKVHCQEALRAYRSLGDRYFEAGALNNLAQVEQINGELESALAHLREAEVMYREADDLDTLAMVLNNCGEVSMELGLADDGRRYHHEALDVALKCGSALRQAAAYLGLGDAAGRRGDREVARTRWETALAIFDAEGSPRAAEVRERLHGTGGGV